MLLSRVEGLNYDTYNIIDDLKIIMVSDSQTSKSILDDPIFDILAEARLLI